MTSAECHSELDLLFLSDQRSTWSTIGDHDLTGVGGAFDVMHYAS